MLQQPIPGEGIQAAGIYPEADQGSCTQATQTHATRLTVSRFVRHGLPSLPRGGNGGHGALVGDFDALGRGLFLCLL